MRYTTKFRLPEKRWYVFDTVSTEWKGVGYDSRHKANKKVDKLNGEILAAKSKAKDYGMIYKDPAPKPRSYRDD